MIDPRPELASISTTLNELTLRVGALADELSKAGQDGIATELFEVERALRNGGRRLRRAVDR